MTHVGDAIRSRRESLDLSQEEVSRRVKDVPRAYIAQIESGRTKWPAKYVRDIEKALGMKHRELDAYRLRDLSGDPVKLPQERSILELAQDGLDWARALPDELGPTAVLGMFAVIKGVISESIELDVKESRQSLEEIEAQIDKLIEGAPERFGVVVDAVERTDKGWEAKIRQVKDDELSLDRICG